jgi:hypothetical protein
MLIRMRTGEALRIRVTLTPDGPDLPVTLWVVGRQMLCKPTAIALGSLTINRLQTVGTWVFWAILLGVEGFTFGPAPGANVSTETRPANVSVMYVIYTGKRSIP